nr:hypothetical protein BaRGS_009209 [Batillaria attramentaria]
MRAVLEWRKETAHCLNSFLTSTQGGSSASSSANQREAAVTRMLLVVCVVYTCCITPSVIQAITRASVEDFFGGGRYNNIFFASLCITHFLESVNCSINFIIYYTMSTRFRETLREIVRRGDKKRVSALSVPSGTTDNDP